MSVLQVKSWIYSKLSTDANLTILTGGLHVYDIVQENVTLPYISYQKTTSKLVHELDTEVRQHALKLVVVAKADSSLTTHNIMALIEDIFEADFAPGDIGAGYNLLSVEMIGTSVEQIDFDIVKGSMDYNICVERLL